jgi:hypothetical protein
MLLRPTVINTSRRRIASSLFNTQYRQLSQVSVLGFVQIKVEGGSLLVV